MSALDSGSFFENPSEDVYSTTEESHGRTKLKLLLDAWYARKREQMFQIQSKQNDIIMLEESCNRNTKNLNARLDELVKIKSNMKLMDQTLSLKQSIHSIRLGQQKIVQELKFLNESFLPYIESRKEYQNYKRWKNSRTVELVHQKEIELEKQHKNEIKKAKDIHEQQLAAIHSYEKKIAAVQASIASKKKKIDKLEQERIKRENDPSFELKRIKDEKEKLKQKIKEEKEKLMQKMKEEKEKQQKALLEQQKREREEKLKEEQAEKIRKEKEEMEVLRRELEALQNSQSIPLNSNENNEMIQDEEDS